MLFIFLLIRSSLSSSTDHFFSALLIVEKQVPLSFIEDVANYPSPFVTNPSYTQSLEFLYLVPIYIHGRMFEAALFMLQSACAASTRRR